MLIFRICIRYESTREVTKKTYHEPEPSFKQGFGIHEQSRVLSKHTPYRVTPGRYTVRDTTNVHYVATTLVVSSTGLPRVPDALSPDPTKLNQSLRTLRSTAGEPPLDTRLRT